MTDLGKGRVSRMRSLGRCVWDGFLFPTIWVSSGLLCPRLPTRYHTPALWFHPTEQPNFLSKWLCESELRQGKTSRENHLQCRHCDPGGLPSILRLFSPVPAGSTQRRETMQDRLTDLPHRRSRLQAPRGQTTGLSGTRPVHGEACGHMLQSCPSFFTPFCLGRGPQINEHLWGHLKQHDAILNSESPEEVRSWPGQTDTKGHTRAHIHHQEAQKTASQNGKKWKDRSIGAQIRRQIPADHETYTWIHLASVELCQGFIKHAWECQPSRSHASLTEGSTCSDAFYSKPLCPEEALPSRNPTHPCHMPHCLYQGQVSAV